MNKEERRVGIIVQSLAVKYRPTSILGLVGQDHVASQVKGMVKQGKFPSTILLSGDSGCGKTTTSRIIARTVNCANLDRKTLTPCGECQSCQLGDKSPDYTEMNMADTRGIDDVRALIQGSRSNPMIGNNRIIVLDEVHQLTAPAQNALLKSLEESSARTLWLLATTNPEKLLPTIVSRCTRFNLTAIEPEVISKRLRIISKREGVDLRQIEGGDEIVKTIVDLSNGRMRDAIAILESALFAFHSDKNISAKTVVNQFLTTGDADLEKLAAELLVSILVADIKGIVRVARTSGNPRGVLSKMRWIIQNLLDDSVGLARFLPYGTKLFKKLAADKSIKIRLAMLIMIQNLLVNIEDRLNRMSVDESVLFLSMIGDFALEHKQ